MNADCRIYILSILLGMIVGYLVMHPYTMLITTIFSGGSNLNTHINLADILKPRVLFAQNMVQMTLAFILFGAVIGLFVGIIISRRRHLLEAKHEIEINKVAIETIKEIMVTLSHHLLNSNTIIGGKVRHIRKKISDEDTIVALNVIEEQGRKIDAVIKSLREVTEIKTADYTSSGEVRMIDIGEEIEDHLKNT